MTEKLYYRVLVGGLTFGDQTPQPGDLIDPERYSGRRWDMLTSLGHVEAAVRDVEDVEDTSEDEDEPVQPEKDYSMMVRDELLNELAEHDLAEEDIEGTGSSGYVTNADLVETLENLTALA